MSDFLVEIQEGGFYGWPYAYTGPHEDPRRKGEKRSWSRRRSIRTCCWGACRRARYAVLHGNRFLAKYRDGLFLAFHGSWNRSERVGYKVAFIPFRTAPTSGPEDFLTGWMLGADQREVWGRPVGLLTLSDGSMLVSDDGGAKIWRIH